MSAVEYSAEELRDIAREANGLVENPDLQGVTDEELESLFVGLAVFIDKLNVWLASDKGVAVYENHDLGHPQVGHKRFFSFGTDDATFDLSRCPRCGGKILTPFDRPATTTVVHCENSACSGHTPGLPVEELGKPPEKLPDFPGEINWRYWLIGTYKGAQL